MYLVKNKHTGEVDPCGGLTAVSQFTGIKTHVLYYAFSVKNLDVYEDNAFHVHRKELIKSNARRLKNEVSI